MVVNTLVEVFVHVDVGYAHHVKAEALELSSAFVVASALPIRCVRATVDFDNELAIERDEIDDVACNWMLAPKLPAI